MAISGDEINLQLIMRYVSAGYENFNQLDSADAKKVILEVLSNLMLDDIEIVKDSFDIGDDRHLIYLILRSALSNEGSDEVVDAFVEKAVGRNSDYINDLFYVCRNQMEAIKEVENAGYSKEIFDDDCRARNEELRKKI